MLRIAYFCLGWLMVILGCIGALLPVMPTTIFLILAAWFFARSSPRFEAWLLGHPRFGPSLVRWREQGAIPGRAKVLACVSMAASFAVLCLSAHPSLWVLIGAAVFLSASALYVVSRPTVRQAGSTFVRRDPARGNTCDL